MDSQFRCHAIFAILPQGPFAGDVYRRLCQFLGEQLTEGVERVSVPGIIVAQARLLSGLVVPAIQPELRGMYSWTTPALIREVCGDAPTDSADQAAQDEYLERTQAVRNFLERVYHELRNLGLMPQERALNYAATNCMTAHGIFESAIKEELELDTIEVEKSPIGPPHSDCWDVKLTFFNPRRTFEQARKVYRLTVNCIDICPVMVGSVRSWSVR